MTKLKQELRITNTTENQTILVSVKTKISVQKMNITYKHTNMILERVNFSKIGMNILPNKFKQPEKTKISEISLLDIPLAAAYCGKMYSLPDKSMKFIMFALKIAVIGFFIM